MFLDRIVSTKQKEVSVLKENVTVNQLEKIISQMEPCRPFAKECSTHKNRNLGLIAEIKKASPSKGLIRQHFDPIELALQYVEAKVDCISVLTDQQYFQGHNDYLREVKNSVSVPILRKDFIIDSIQILEARSIGADAILLIASILTSKQLKEYTSIAKDYGLDVLIEVHSEDECDGAIQAESSLIGINNRNLKTFEVNLNATEQLCKIIPFSIPIVSESGLSNPIDLQFVKNAGASTVLIGEHFMRQENVVDAVNELMS